MPYVLLSFACLNRDAIGQWLFTDLQEDTETREDEETCGQVVSRKKQYKTLNMHEQIQRKELQRQVWME